MLTACFLSVCWWNNHSDTFCNLCIDFLSQFIVTVNVQFSLKMLSYEVSFYDLVDVKQSEIFCMLVKNFFKVNIDVRSDRGVYNFLYNSELSIQIVHLQDVQFG